MLSVVMISSNTLHYSLTISARVYLFIYFSFFISLCTYRCKKLYICHDWCERFSGAYWDIKIVILRMSALFENLAVRHRSFTFNSNKSPTWCNNFSFYYPDVCVQLNMFRAFSCPSLGAQWLQWQPLVLPSYRGDSRAVFVVGPAGR